ncbi:hypothetical protein KCP70_14685 [Salmonella enterica subsp. enterica]|nr:hypothetical protein KCP70_14685 [Salmonella enterica subsp. enterica]
MMDFMADLPRWNPCMSRAPLIVRVRQLRKSIVSGRVFSKMSAIFYPPALFFLPFFSYRLSVWR